jgi:hypothetical protein
MLGHDTALARFVAEFGIGMCKAKEPHNKSLQRTLERRAKFGLLGPAMSRVMSHLLGEERR